MAFKNIFKSLGNSDKTKKQPRTQRQTTIKTRITLIGIISLVTAALLYMFISLTTLYSTISKQSRSEISSIASAYTSAIDNADIGANNKFIDKLFEDYVETTETNSFGFVLSGKYTVIGETFDERVTKGTNFEEMYAADKGYNEIYSLMNSNLENKVKEDVKRINFKGEEYLIAFCVCENYEGFYVYIFTPYSEIIGSYKQMIILEIVVFIVMLICSAIICMQAADRISKPIRDVCKRLGMLSEGDATSPTPLCDRNDETKILVNSLENTINSLHGYIEDIKDVLSAVSEGNLLVRSNTKYMGDFHEIRRCLDKILVTLNTTFGAVDNAVVQVKDCSAQVSGGAAVLSGNASNDAATIEELTASMSEISVKVNKNAEQARLARELTHEADKGVSESNEIMGSMVVAIEEMKVSSAEISKIIKIIDDIAFQTNILSLNAAVEAAKAGTAGKGFAVVADEVRNLASKSADAASRTDDLITQSLEAMKKSAELAEKSSKALTDVVKKVKDVNSLVDDIATSAENQAADISAVNIGMEQINGSIQTTSSTAEQSASASQELTDQSANLSDIIQKFRFEKQL